MVEGGTAAPASALPVFLRVTLRVWVKAFRAASTGARPLADLAIRLLVAQYFLRSGLVKAGSWDSALALARHEYPVSWMSPETAALVGIGIELAGRCCLRSAC